MGQKKWQGNKQSSFSTYSPTSSNTVNQQHTHTHTMIAPQSRPGVVGAAAASPPRAVVLAPPKRLASAALSAALAASLVSPPFSLHALSLACNRAISTCRHVHPYRPRHHRCWCKAALQHLLPLSLRQSPLGLSAPQIWFGRGARQAPLTQVGCAMVAAAQAFALWVLQRSQAT
jgi:hypothetical protein